MFSLVRIKYGSNATDTVTGVIIYPDDFSFSEAGVASMAFGIRRTITQINAADWAALEEAGCVFLPLASLMSYDAKGLYINESAFAQGYYYSATAGSASQAVRAFFNTGNFTLSFAGINKYGLCSVRLAQDY